MSKGPGTLCYTWLSTPRATYIQDRDANEHRQANTLKDNPNQGKTGALRDTPSTGGKPSGTHTPPRGSLGSTWGHAHRRREPGVGSSAAPAHLAPKASPQAPPVCVPVRACVRTRPRAPPPVGGEVRTAPGAARLARRGLPGERLPWSAERGSILMDRPGALPPGQPGSLLPLLLPVSPKSLRPAVPARDPHSKGRSPGGRSGDLAPGPSWPRLPGRRPRRVVRSGARAEQGTGTMQGLPGLGLGTKQTRQLGAQVLPWNGGGYPGGVGNKGGNLTLLLPEGPSICCP